MFTGKVNDVFFTENILPYTGKTKQEVIIGPNMGVDSAILKVGDKYMAIAEDPIFPSISMSPEDFAYVTVHIGASDVAVMGIKPQYMTYSLLLPPGTEEEYIGRLVKAINKYAEELDISIAGGHTGYYGAVTIPTVGGITVWGVSDKFISPKEAKIGDDVIMTKGAAIEAAALLAYELDELLAERLPEQLIKKAKDRFSQISVVKDAEIAISVDGVHAMHDATEGGLFRGIWEISQASGVGMSIWHNKIILPEDIEQVCAFFNLNPFEIISEGTLLLTCDSRKSEELLQVFKDNGIEAAIIGKVTEKADGCVLIEEEEVKPLLPPQEDKFWEVFFGSLEFKKRNIEKSEQDNAAMLCSELKQAVEVLKRENIYEVLPEIGANIAYYRAEDISNMYQKRMKPSEAAAIPGRILRYKNQTEVLGEPEIGASVYMGGTLTVLKEYFSEISCVVNLRNNSRIIGNCKKAGLKLVDMPTPKEYRQSDEDFFKDLRELLESLEEFPDIITIPDRINLEKLILVFDRSLDKLIEKILKVCGR